MDAVLQYLKKNQLLQFAVIGFIVFLLYKLSDSTEQPEVLVTQSTIAELIDIKTEILGHPLSEEEKQAIIDQYIHEEILLQEAYSQGLDKNDSKIRDRLIDQMRFIMSRELEEPGEDTLMAFYQDHIDLYLQPEFITFDQVFFKSSSKQPEPEEFLKRLEHTNDFESLGDSLWLGGTLKGYARADLKIIFGVPFTNRLFEVGEGTWSGPFSSQHGIHYVRVTHKEIPEAYPYENVKAFVREDWAVFRSASAFESQMNELKKGYTIRFVDNEKVNE